MAIMGSFLCEEEGRYYNRAFFVTPEGEVSTYDKHHLFRMGGENDYFTPGNRQTIVDYKGWKICMQVCYDLRFPVWTRNVDNKYDLLIYIANWPEVRKKAWKLLLKARAIENMAYVCGVNRVGVDGEDLTYRGDSMIIDPKGDKVGTAGKREEITRTCTLKKAELEAFRKKFPAWKDADSFVLK